MFCRQCEQTQGGKGCTVQGVCGKSPEAATLQDLLIHGLKGIGVFAHAARGLGAKDEMVDRFVIESLFTAITNVNFDTDRLEARVRRAVVIREQAKELFLSTYFEKNKKKFFGVFFPSVVEWTPKATTAELLQQGKEAAILIPSLNEDIQSLRELLLYGLKGMAAYADHAAILGTRNETVNAFFHKGLAALADETKTSDELTALVMEQGQANLACMETLDGAHTATFGTPVPTSVSLGVKKGPAIVVSGHDLHDLRQLLEQTEGKGVNIYTHGEMLPAHAYPELKKFRHLAGHYGTAWQNQHQEFSDGPFAILMTTNCIQRPMKSYADRIYTTGLVEYPGVGHITAKDNAKDFSKVIAKAIELGGFTADRDDKSIMVGFAHGTLLGAADKILGAVKTGALRHIFLMGGCDGAKPGRNYYTEFAEKVPKDSVILTLACGKFRFNRLDLGTLGEFPRLMDVGQCNDAYSAIKVAATLASALKTDINSLPLSIILSWYEQKAVAILITLLSLGIKNMRLGPTLPAFVSPGVLKLLVEKFGIKPITTPDEDLKAILG
jgi:hydroxylamine reductase